ncbi:hypothetical protein GUITHDRAFT_140909 [Guillardia theta CCMP2712]|uniref:Uncharacterized protein n=1 Tax=Guillardia theta (strain CCMP2712) TaxID=905079 RepID=L1J2J1_GUITC|nr:hypothetical protein GUITHDRAFT_140909 [Guillardia theta CCMP2712]EKX42743.1 hypothetical protein GUITHDRAFT_140909 [Guillardia theta CCMP2712]|eukprot:XP_005829723.1 hypothetical protein GUITHDRAFT_140909 [Guillardia theta CCMP2712]
MLSSTCVAPSTSSPSSSSLRGGGGGGTDKPRSVLTGNYSSAAMFMDFAVFCMTIYCEQRLKQEQESARREKTREVMGLARFYAEKDPPDYSRAAEAYGQAAAMGDELARYNLAVLYLHVRTHKRLACSDCTQGVGVDQDSQLAASLLAKAAEQNLPDASYLLGTMHVRGLGVERDAEKAVKLFEQAAAMGQPEREGQGCDKPAGHEHAIEALADCHARGIGTRRSLLRAAQLFSYASWRRRRRTNVCDREADQAKGRERQVRGHVGGHDELM